MKNLDIINDIGAPALVTGVNIFARGKTTPAFGTTSWADLCTYAMAGGGYLLTYMGWGPKNYSGFIKNVAIAAAPLAFEKLYNQLKGTPVVGRVSRPVAMNRVSRYPGPANESPFQSVRLV